MDLIVDGVRWVLWLICKGCFFLIDSLYNIIKPVITFDIATNSTLWKWWEVLCCILFLFTLLRVFAMFIKSMVDEEYLLKMNPINTIVRIVAIAIVIAFMPMTVKTFSAFTSALISSASVSFKVENNFAEKQPITGDKEKDAKIKKIYEEYEGMPSQIFISSASNGTYPPYQLIDINETEGGLDNVLNGIPIISGGLDLVSGLIGADGSYVYFQDTTMLIFLIVEGICGAYLFFLTAMQIAQRDISIAIKILISPYPISGIVNPDDRSFSLWVKLLIADLMSNFIQYLILLFVFMITSSTAVQQFGIVGQGIFFLGGMLAVLVGPGQIAQIIGGDGMGLFQTMQGIQAMSALKGITMSAGRVISSATGGAVALGTYGAGRALGLESLGNFPNDSDSSGANFGGGDPWGVGASGQPNDGTGGGGSSIPPEAFNEPSTEKQRYAANQMGFDVSNMSKGQASLQLERAGKDPSYWSKYKGSSIDSFKGGSATGTINKRNKTYGFGNTSTGYTSSSGTDAYSSPDTESYAVDSNNDDYGSFTNQGAYESALNRNDYQYTNDVGSRNDYSEGQTSYGSLDYESINEAGYEDTGFDSYNNQSNYQKAYDGYDSFTEESNYQNSYDEHNGEAIDVGQYSGTSRANSSYTTVSGMQSDRKNQESSAKTKTGHATQTKQATPETFTSQSHQKANPQMTQSQEIQKPQTPRMSRSGSIARKVGDGTSKGNKAAYVVGKAAYATAARRIMGQRSVYRGGRYIQKSTKAQMLSNMHKGFHDIKQNTSKNLEEGEDEE